MIGVCITTYREKAPNVGWYPTYVVDAESTGVRRGIGPCLMEAWDLALKDGCDYIVQIDAGGSHDPKQIDRFMTALYKGNDVVVGSRFMAGARYIGNPKRRIASRFATWMCNLKTKGNFSDWTSGYRAFSSDALTRLLKFEYKAQMHFWQAEVLHNAWLSRMTIGEVPITYTAGRSSFNRKVALEALRVWRNL